MTKRPLPESRKLKEQRAQRRTARVAMAFLLVLIVSGLLLYLFA